MKVVAIVQARMGSTRLPRKVMRDICGTPMIGLLLARLSHSKEIDQIIVATSVNVDDDALAKYIETLGYECTRGDENNVLHRYLTAACNTDADIIVRITGDCPLVDADVVDQLVAEFKSLDVDYLSNTLPPTYPDGLDVEVFSTSALNRAFSGTTSLYDYEHVTPYLKDSGAFKTKGVCYSEDLSGLRWTVDERVDLEVVTNIFLHFYPEIHFGWEDVLELYRSQPELFRANQLITRNEGASIGPGQKLWKRAKSIIPGGGMLLSKRAEMFLPDYWPTYFSKAQGCRVWDLDGNEYIDMSLMGVGTNTLGYCQPEIDEAVIKAVQAGNMSTLNCAEEVHLAERLIELHPWAEMARFARTGGEVNAISIRIARAATGRDKVAVCGYHGWHDWYLSANLSNRESLSGHLLPGLDAAGVPKNLVDTVFPFEYNQFNQLEKIVETNDIGAIKMEVARNQEPEEGFLEKVRELATRRNIVLIFDECTSGFRETLGGLHIKYGVEPDLALFGKALGNGYAITAVIGRREVMEVVQSTFISSTFWTERIGPTAALKTLEIMQRDRTWETITSLGLDIRKRWQALAVKHGLSLDHLGIPALAGFTVRSSDWMAYKTLITQEMLKAGYLASNAIYASTQHSEDLVDAYFAELDPIFSLIRECEHGRDVKSLLKGPICHAGFRRLN